LSATDGGMRVSAARDGDGRVRGRTAHEDVERLTALARMLVEKNAQLETALESRIVIEQAKGVLVERYALAPPEAFELLRRAARTSRMRIRDLAANVVASRDTPPEVARVYPGPDRAA